MEDLINDGSNDIHRQVVTKMETTEANTDTSNEAKKT